MLSCTWACGPASVNGKSQAANTCPSLLWMHFLEMSCASGFTSGSCFPSSKPPGSRVMWGMCVPSLWRIEAAYSLIFSQMVWMSPSPSLSSASTCDPSTFLPWQFAASLYKSQVVHGKNDMVKIFLTSTLRSFFCLGWFFFVISLLFKSLKVLPTVGFPHYSFLLLLPWFHF